MVDFGTLPGGVQVVCVTGSVTSGFDALQQAGFAWTGTQRFPSLICRIDGQPASDPCVSTPPANRYWSYWTASGPGATWVYSDQGAGTRVPPAGSVDGWAFVDGCERTPGSGPCPSSTTTRPATTTTTAVTTTVTSASASGSGVTPGSADGGSGTTAPRGASATVASGSGATTSLPNAAAGGIATASGRAPVAGAGVAKPRAVAGGADPGSPWGALLGGAIVLAVGGLAARRAVARRRIGGEP